ncbi:hypothetical protein SC206_19810 [Rouxiella sp. T17]|uniref:hypothetical protein n=1 Tax=Rouxiella sp. T17 TaxID=3085684 RepID=UPI002FC7C4C6
MNVENNNQVIKSLTRPEIPQHLTGVTEDDLNNNVDNFTFKIDLQDPNAPEACLIEKMNENDKSWLGMLLKPFDMIYYLCGKAGEELYQNYQQQVDTTVDNFGKSILNLREELKRIMGREESDRFYKLYETNCNLRGEIQDVKADSADKKILLASIDQQLNVMIENLPSVSTHKKLLRVLLQGCCLRTPLMMLQMAFSTPIEEIPGGYSKVGLQFQLVIPTLEILKNLFHDKPIENIFLQPYLHLEAGASAKLDFNGYLPVTFQACMTGMRVTHFGLNITLEKTAKGWIWANTDYIMEAVNRFEGNIAINRDIDDLTPGIQAKLGGDTVRQLVFPCNSLGTTKFFSQCAVRSLGALGLGGLALGGGLNFPTVKAASIIGQDLISIPLDISGLVQPNKIVDIVELLTLGIDLSMGTNTKVSGLGNLDLMLMNRLNGSYLVEHDFVQPELIPAMSKSTSNTEQHVRKRKISEEISHAKK